MSSLKRFPSAFFVVGVWVVNAIACYGQIEVKRQVAWLEPQVQFSGDGFSKKLCIEGQSRVDSCTGLPLAGMEIELPDWDGNATSISVELAPNSTVAANDSENSIIGYGHLPQTVSYDIFVDRKRTFLKIWVCPILQSNEPGCYLKMTSFSLLVDYKKKVSGGLKSAPLVKNENSVLASGRWLKVRVSRSGIHRIPYGMLTSWGFADPTKVNVFGQGGKMLPRSNSVSRVDDLVENAVWHQNNAIYFYAQGPVEWSYNAAKQMYTHKSHDFSGFGYYFLSEQGSGVSVSNAGNDNNQSSNYESSEFDDFAYYEKETNNLLKSGSRWFGEKFGAGSLSSFDVKFSFPNTVTGKQASVSSELIARSGVATGFDVSLNGSSEPLQTIAISNVDLSASTGAAAKEGRATTLFTPAGDLSTFTIKYNYSTSTSTGYLDKIDVQVRRKLIVDGPQMAFRDLSSVGSANVSRFNVELADSSDIVWDVTDYLSPRFVTLEGADKSKWFIYNTNTIREFVAFNPLGDLPTPEFVEEVANQNLHGLPQVDYLIVTNAKYLSEAKRLADLHAAHNGLTVQVVEQRKIYNEFSSGCPDVTAIRSFVRMFYDRAGSDNELMPKYLLLFGDGNFANKGVLSDNELITFQSDNSIDHTGSYVSDDYFGFLDATEGVSMLTEAIDIGIGRFPATTLANARVMVDKSVSYVLQQANGPWRNKVTFVADDGDSNIHMTQAEQLTQKVAFNHPEFNVGKIYFDTYPKSSTAGGQRYPDVEVLIDKSLAEGTLIFNYTGHGGGGGLASERVITSDIIKKWTNWDRLTLLMTATCEFSAFDQLVTSAGEQVLLNPNGGGIALLSTTRVVYSNQNYEINNNFYNYALKKDSDGLPYRFGEISKLTKRATSGSVNKLNFSLLGDPALRLASSWLGVEVTKINNVDVAESVDTLKALSLANISGRVVDASGNLIPDFDGSAVVAVYDKARTITTMGNGGGAKFTYDSYENVLYIGKVDVSKGEFSTSFKVPKDILYDVDNGRISIYATNGTAHANGYYDQVKIGSFQVGGVDTIGPRISLFLNDTAFVDGGQVAPMPLFIAKVFDENGINTSNNSIGHDVVLTIDGGLNGRYIMNSCFAVDSIGHQSGTLLFQMPVLAEGEHTLTLKVWDTFNNSNSQDLNFVVVIPTQQNAVSVEVDPHAVTTGENLVLDDLKNASQAIIEVSYTIYSIDGKKMGVHKKTALASEMTFGTISVDMVAGNGQKLKKGIYLIQFDVVDANGDKAQMCKKVMVTD